MILQVNSLRHTDSRLKISPSLRASEIYEALSYIQMSDMSLQNILSLSYCPHSSDRTQFGYWSQGPVYGPSVSNSDIVNVCCVPIWLFGMGPNVLTTSAPGGHCLGLLTALQCFIRPAIC